MAKRPVLIGIANAVFPGLGYIILKDRLVFGWLLAAGTFLSLLLAFSDPALYASLLTASSVPGRVFEISASILFLAAFGYDAYALARSQQPDTPELS